MRVGRAPCGIHIDSGSKSSTQTVFRSSVNDDFPGVNECVSSFQRGQWTGDHFILRAAINSRTGGKEDQKVPVPERLLDGIFEVLFPTLGYHLQFL